MARSRGFVGRGEPYRIAAPAATASAAQDRRAGDAFRPPGCARSRRGASEALGPVGEVGMVLGFAVLLVCQLIGEIASRALGLPVPGPVLGLVLLVAGLAAWGRGRGDAEVAASPVARVGDGLLANLGLLFVPAGVGVIQYGGLLKAQASALALALVGSTAVTLVVTVVVFVLVSRLTGRRASGGAPGNREDAP